MIREQGETSVVTAFRESFALHLIYSTVRLEASGPKETRVGTAFGYMHVIEGKGVFPLLVTNRHLVEGATEGKFFFTRSAGHLPDKGPVIGGRLDIAISGFDNLYHLHPDPSIDIAIIPYSKLLQTLIDRGDRPYFRPLPASMIPTESDLQAMNLVEEVVFIGYPDGRFDSSNLIPLVRRGITATPPIANFNGMPQVLIDASVFPGSSGSPVFVVDIASLGLNPLEVERLPRPIKLLGVVTEVMTQPGEGPIVPKQIPTDSGDAAIFDQMIDIGVVLRSSLIIETIENFISTHTILPSLAD